MSRKILIFTLSYYPFVGGDGVAIREITNRINPSEIEFHMVTLRFDSTLSRREQIGNVLVHRIGWGYKKPTPRLMRSLRYRFIKLWFQFIAGWYGHRLNKTEHFDAIWAMMAHSAGVPAAIFKLFHPATPYILTLQEGDPPEHVERVMRPLWLLFARAFTKADIVQTISNFLASWARRRGFKGPLEVIPNGVDVSNFTQEFPQSKLVELKQRLGKKDNEIYLITTSRLVYKNATDDVIRAMPLLPANISFLVLGIGPDEDALKKLAADLGVSGRVRFLDHISHEEMPLYLKISDIFIRPSRSEGFGNSFIEAMAAGLPTIATHEGGIADFLFDARRNPDKQPTGWAVDRDNPSQIAAAVKEIISNPEQVKKVIENARALVTSHYDWDDIAALMRSKIFSTIL